MHGRRRHHPPEERSGLSRQRDTSSSDQLELSYTLEALTAYGQALTAYSQALTAFEALTAYGQALTAYGQALTAYSQALTALSSYSSWHSYSVFFGPSCPPPPGPGPSTQTCSGPSSVDATPCGFAQEEWSIDANMLRTIFRRRYSLWFRSGRMVHRRKHAPDHLPSTLLPVVSLRIPPSSHFHQPHPRTFLPSCHSWTIESIKCAPAAKFISQRFWGYQGIPRDQKRT